MPDHQELVASLRRAVKSGREVAEPDHYLSLMEAAANAIEALVNEATDTYYEMLEAEERRDL